MNNYKESMGLDIFQNGWECGVAVVEEPQYDFETFNNTSVKLLHLACELDLVTPKPSISQFVNVNIDLASVYKDKVMTELQTAIEEEIFKSLHGTKKVSHADTTPMLSDDIVDTAWESLKKHHKIGVKDCVSEVPAQKTDKQIYKSEDMGLIWGGTQSQGYSAEGSITFSPEAEDAPIEKLETIKIEPQMPLIIFDETTTGTLWGRPKVSYDVIKRPPFKSKYP